MRHVPIQGRTNLTQAALTGKGEKILQQKEQVISTIASLIIGKIARRNEFQNHCAASTTCPQFLQVQISQEKKDRHYKKYLLREHVSEIKFNEKEDKGEVGRGTLPIKTAPAKEEAVGTTITFTHKRGGVFKHRGLEKKKKEPGVPRPKRKRPMSWGKALSVTQTTRLPG